MAAIAGTQTTTNMVGIREDLSNIIYRIDPEDTPFLSGIGRGPKTSQTLTEWQTDALEAPAQNAIVEGDEASFAAPTPTVRLGNYTQISRKTVLVSGTAEAVDAAGRKSELAMQTAKRGAELRRDQEYILLQNRGGDAGSSSTPRYLAPLLAFIKSNTNKGTGGTPAGADPSYTSGVPGAGRTDNSTTRAFTEDILKDVLQKVWSAGGKPKVLMVGPSQKEVVSGFSGLAQRTVDVGRTSAATVIAAVDVYVSNWGIVRVIPNRWQRNRDAFVLDYGMASVRYLRPHKRTPLAKTGDAEKHMILCEWTLQVNQEKALGLAADLT